MKQGDYADLHVHSQASDGTRSPEEIILLARANGVGILSVADHNTLAAQARAKELCDRYDIRYIPAVELDALSGDEHFHILAYDYDPEDAAFRDFVSHVRFALDEISVRLIEKMSKDFRGISFKTYIDFPDMTGYGGWKALHYLVSRGAAASLSDGLRFYGEYDITYSKAGFPTIRTTCDRIRRAGGYAVLAHPGQMIDTSSIEGFKNGIRNLIEQGVQGVECYYPAHTGDITDACLAVCREASLYITSGSDDHGSFGQTEIGQMRITPGMLRLRAR